MFKKIFDFNGNINKEDKVLINILTRTANRPVGFQNCRQSIIKQKYKNVKHFVSYENEVDFEYINFKDIVKIKVNRYVGPLLLNPDGFLHAPYNLYCNELLNYVENGWILFLDDDDNLLHNKVLNEIISEIKKVDEDTMLIWQMRYPDGKILPQKKHFKSKKIEINNIGTSCFIFHSKYKEIIEWDEWKGADFRYINALFDEIQKKKWIEKVFIQINNYGDLGKKNDISKIFESKKIFNKTIFWRLIPKYHFEIFDIYFFQINTYRSFWNKIFRIILRYLKYFNKIKTHILKKLV